MSRPVTDVASVFITYMNLSAVLVMMADGKVQTGPDWTLLDKM